MAEPVTTTSPTANIFDRLMQSNPLALGLVALVLGALIGLLLPETSQENALLGPKRDELAQQAQDTVRDLSKKVTVVAHTAQGAVHDVLDKTQDAAKGAFTEALESVKEEAHQQGLPVGS